MRKRATDSIPALRRIFFVVPYPLGVAPSQRFRFEQYFKYLKSRDIRYEVASFWSERAWETLYRNGYFLVKFKGFFAGFLRRIILLLRIRKYDIIFLHRECMPAGPPIFEYVIAKLLRRKIIYDFDDAIWLPNTSKQNNFASRFKFHQKVGSICKWSWKISCGNDFLAEFAKKYNNNTTIIPTTIDASYHKSERKERKDEPVVIGWTGTHSTLRYLDPIIPLLKELKDSYPVDILIISNQKPNWMFKDYEFLQWDKQEEIRQLDRIDIGIMPLSDSIWEKGKCGFKALQYMSLGKPAVVSDVGINHQIIDHGMDGFLCKSNDDFKKYLTLLVEDKRTYNAISANSRKKVLENYSVGSNSDLFLSLFL